MYETVDPPSSTHIPAPYEEVGVATEVKSSRDIQLTANEAWSYSEGNHSNNTKFCLWTSDLVTLLNLL